MAGVAPEILTDALQRPGIEKSSSPQHNMSIDALLMLIHSERLKTLKEQTTKEFKELSQRQSHVRELHDIMKALNKATNEKGDVDLTDKGELAEMLKRAKELGVNVKDDKKKFTKDERDRLVENLRMTIEDLNVQNDMQLQTVQRLTNERYESYRLAQTILKPLHEDKQNKARKIAS